MQTARRRGRLCRSPFLREVLPWLEFAQVYGRTSPRWSSSRLFQYRQSLLSWNAATAAATTGDVGTMGSSSRRCSPCNRSVFMFRRRAWFSRHNRNSRNSRKILRHGHGTTSTGSILVAIVRWGRHVGRNEGIVCKTPVNYLFLRAPRRGCQIHPTRTETARSNLSRNIKR